MALPVLLGLFLIMLALAVINPRAALLTALFFASWIGLELDIGLRVVFHQLVMAPVVIVMLLRLAHPGLAPRRIAVGSLFIVFALYAVCNSAIGIALLPDVEIQNSVLRGPQARAIIQILLFVFSLAPIILVPLLLHEKDDAYLMLRLWLASVTVLAIIGWLQLAVWYGTGTNPIPIGAFNSLLGGVTDDIREGRFNFEGLRIYRMNAFTNEPRNLGAVLATAMVALQAIALTVRNIKAARMTALWLFFLVTAIFTYSTTFVAVWLLGTIVLVPGLWVARVPLQRSPTSLLAALAALATPVLIGFFIASSAGIPVLDLISERTIERLEGSGGVEDFDLAISAWLAANPERLWFGGGLGNAHLYAMPFLDPEFAAYAEGQVFNAKTMVLRFTSELGLAGVALFAAFSLSRIFAARGPRTLVPMVPSAAPMGLAMLAMLAATSQIYTEITFMLGAMVLLAGLQRPAAPPLPLRSARPA